MQESFLTVPIEISAKMIKLSSLNPKLVKCPILSLKWPILGATNAVLSKLTGTELYHVAPYMVDEFILKGVVSIDWEYSHLFKLLYMKF